MIIVNHRVNTIKKLKETPKEFGIEIDVRPYNKKIILNHDPFCDGEDFEEFIKEYNHSLLILNIKSEGIEEQVLNIIKKYNVKNYFFLDITFPFMVKYMKKGVKEMACRFSEYESLETCLNLKEKVEWVFVDNFTKLPVENDSFNKLRKHFKICIVSPELLNRNEIELTKKLVKKFPVDAVLTNNPGAWTI